MEDGRGRGKRRTRGTALDVDNITKKERMFIAFR